MGQVEMEGDRRGVALDQCPVEAAKATDEEWLWTSAQWRRRRRGAPGGARRACGQASHLQAAVGVGIVALEEREDGREMLCGEGGERGGTLPAELGTRRLGDERGEVRMQPLVLLLAVPACMRSARRIHLSCALGGGRWARW